MPKAIIFRGQGKGQSGLIKLGIPAIVFIPSKIRIIPEMTKIIFETKSKLLSLLSTFHYYITIQLKQQIVYHRVLASIDIFAAR